MNPGRNPSFMYPTISSSHRLAPGSFRRWALFLAGLLLWCGIAESRTRGKARHFRAKATAYSQSGTTADGGQTHKGVVAADPRYCLWAPGFE